MITKKLIYSRTVKCDNTPDFNLEYYITQDDCRFSEQNFLYGITIEKICKESEKEVFSAPECISSYEKAGCLLEKLASNTVTPMGADEAIEVILTIF